MQTFGLETALANRLDTKILVSPRSIREDSEITILIDSRQPSGQCRNALPCQVPQLMKYLHLFIIAKQGMN